MTGPEFWLDVPSNTIATIIGVGIGIPVGFWFEHRIERQREYKSNVGRLESLRGVIFVLRESLDANLSAIELCDREVGSCRIIYEPGLELFTWEAIKPQVVEFLGNPGFIARIARFFSRVKGFESTLALHRQTGNEERRAAIVSIGPQLRHEGQAIRDALPVFRGASDSKTSTAS